MKLGCCYYPEHWPEEMWAADAKRMAALGLSLVRIGEFAWSRIEPSPGEFDWGWMDRAVETLGQAGLKIIMGTPTATPPKWLIDAYPDVLPLDAHGLPRKFGSRRHYCFSSQTYRRESRRITEAMVKRYGDNPAIVMWQTDNEFGCHSTVESFSADAAAAFRVWLAARYETVEALNTAWGNVFWSMEYRSFDEIDPPAAAVTEMNPAHRMAWKRFSSDQVAGFHAEQAELIRAHAAGRDITHNFMGHFTDFDHHTFAKEQMDVATWDSYPLGFLEQAWWDAETKAKYVRTGHPDFAAFHHDLYRGLCAGGRWGIMEQQPGPVNWARFNPAPLPGMVALWTMEAAAHGAEMVSYFRWRQAPFAQEQMHAGLNRPDNKPDLASEEAASVVSALAEIGDLPPTPQADVALVYDYEAEWATRIQPQGASFRYSEIAFAFYSALRRLGQSIDIVGPGASLAGYKVIVVPANIMCSDLAVDPGAQIVIGPRSGSKTDEFSVPDGLAPGELSDLIDVTVTRVESLRAGVSMAGKVDGKAFRAERWREFVDSPLTPAVQFEDGHGAVWRNKTVSYVACWPDEVLLRSVLGHALTLADIAVADLPESVRIRRRGDLVFATNYGDRVDLIASGCAAPGAEFLVGAKALEPASVAVWRG